MLQSPVDCPRWYGVGLENWVPEVVQRQHCKAFATSEQQAIVQEELTARKNKMRRDLMGENKQRAVLGSGKGRSGR